MEAATVPEPQEDNVELLRKSLQVTIPEELITYTNVLVYGDPGAGKTYFCGTAADLEDTSPVLILDVEGGVTTLRKRSNVDVVPIRSMGDIESVYNKLYKSIENNQIYYSTICIDSLTELADLDIRTIMKEAYNRNPSNIDIDVPSPREWGKTRNHIRVIVRAFRDLPCHVIYTASASSISEEGFPTKYFPGFSGKLRLEVPGFVDIVGYLTARTERVTGETVVKREMQVLGTNRVVAKDRTNSLGEDGIIHEPRFPEMWKTIRES